MLPFVGRLGPARAKVGLGFAVVGWFRRFCPSPPALVLVRFRRRPLFFFLALSGFARSRPGVLVFVFSLSLFLLRSPLGVPVKQVSFHFHAHLTFIFLHPHLHLIQ